MASRLKLIGEVVPGDTFMYQGRNTQVKKIDRMICMHKVHINESDCYENFTQVLVTSPAEEIVSV